MYVRPEISAPLTISMYVGNSFVSIIYYFVLSRKMSCWHPGTMFRSEISVVPIPTILLHLFLYIVGLAPVSRDSTIGLSELLLQSVLLELQLVMGKGSMVHIKGICACTLPISCTYICILFVCNLHVQCRYLILLRYTQVLISYLQIKGTCIIAHYPTNQLVSTARHISLEQTNFEQPSTRIVPIHPLFDLCRLPPAPQGFLRACISVPALPSHLVQRVKYSGCASSCSRPPSSPLVWPPWSRHRANS